LIDGNLYPTCITTQQVGQQYNLPVQNCDVMVGQQYNLPMQNCDVMVGQQHVLTPKIPWRPKTGQLLFGQLV
jgi:hypothetical protein